MVSVLYQVSSFYSYGLSVPLHGTALWRQEGHIIRSGSYHCAPLLDSKKLLVSLREDWIQTSVEPPAYGGNHAGLTILAQVWMPWRNHGSAEYYAVPLPTAVSDTYCLCHCIRASNKKKMLFQVFLFCGKNWKEQVAHAPGSGQLSLLLALVSRAKGLVE